MTVKELKFKPVLDEGVMPSEYTVKMIEENDFVVKGFPDGWERSTLTNWLLNLHSRNTVPMVVMDIGAYTGIYANLAALYGTNVTAFAFEPLPQVYSRLAENIELNTPEFPAGNTAKGFNIGLSDSNRSTVINVTGGSPLPSGSSIGPHASRATIKEVNIDLQTGDDFLAIHNPDNIRVGLIKIDVEEHELSVLKGLENTLRNNNAYVFVELLTPKEAIPVIEYMLSLGYDWVVQMNDAAVNATDILSIVDVDKLVITPSTTNFVFNKDAFKI